MQRDREEDFRATKAKYVEPFASRPPFAFCESSESSGEGKYVEQEIFESLKCVAVVGKGLKGTLKHFWRQTIMSTPTVIIINDFEEKK